MKKKIILDCDPGHDDAVAIMLAAASDKIEILGITCVAGNATLENTKLNSLKIFVWTKGNSDKFLQVLISLKILSEIFLYSLQFL